MLVVNYVNKGTMFSLQALDIGCISVVKNAFQNRGPFLGDESHEIEVCQFPLTHHQTEIMADRVATI